ncbi:DUF4180 domain-containing protein [Pedobacter metabolipauper]|uniref:Uncharacterized protein DUF4180 n=1 Tax=Pedobacter metabolipauper TaxID=425513 RepID=A0A4R6T2C2_9SPHI|nr:DUF4180 domain-containing protein [Pedobacter metabolipauper]TDQ11848.1 uncharacterized protein DUF4180 [Pedobacter metabolipauper]
MNIVQHESPGGKIAEVESDRILITNSEDGLQILVDLYYQDFGKIIIHEKNITPAFFDLKSGIAGEILQKFVNFKVRLVILGDFSKHPGQSIKDFIFESNKGRQVNFSGSLEQALEKFK